MCIRDSLYKTNKRDLLSLLVTFIITVIFGIETGVLSGVILSILQVLIKSSRPHIVELGSILGTSYYKNLERFDEAQRLDQILILRFDHSLYFANAEYFSSKVEDFLESSSREIYYVVIDASHIDAIDSAGMHVLSDMDHSLKTQGVELHLASASGPVRDALFLAGLLKEENKHHISVHNAIISIEARKNDNDGLSHRKVNPLQTNG